MGKNLIKKRCTIWCRHKCIILPEAKYSLIFQLKSVQNCLERDNLIEYYYLLSTYLDDYLPYARHHNPLLIRNRSWILTILTDRIFPKKLLENKEINFKNGVKNIQTAGYNGARKVDVNLKLRVLIKSGYYILPSPSTALVETG